MGRSIAKDSISFSHETITICKDGPYNDAYNQKGQDTAIPTQAFQPHVHGLAAPDTPYTASVRVQELP